MKSRPLLVLLLMLIFSQAAYGQDQPFDVKFPEAPDTPASLGEARDNASTRLKLSISASATSMVIGDASRFPSTGAVMIDGREIVIFTGKSGSTLTGLLRGREGTAAMVHAAGVAVEMRLLSLYHNTLSLAVRETQGKLGYGESLPSADKYLKGTGPGRSEWRPISELSGAPVDISFITKTPSSALTNEQALSLLATGLVKNTTGTGVLSIAVASDLPSGIDAAKINTGAVSNSEFNFLDGVGSALQPQIDSKQPLSAILSDFAGLTQASNKGVYFDSGTTAATFDFTPFARTLLDDADASAGRATLDAARNSLVTFTGPTQARSYALPDSAQTLAGLNVAQTWGAQQAYSAKIAGNTSGVAFESLPNSLANFIGTAGEATAQVFALQRGTPGGAAAPASPYVNWQFINRPNASAGQTVANVFIASSRHGDTAALNGNAEAVAGIFSYFESDSTNNNLAGQNDAVPSWNFMNVLPGSTTRGYGGYDHVWLQSALGNAVGREILLDNSSGADSPLTPSPGRTVVLATTVKGANKNGPIFLHNSANGQASAHQGGYQFLADSIVTGFPFIDVSALAEPIISAGTSLDTRVDDFILKNGNSSSFGPALEFNYSRGSVANPTVTQTNDILGNIVFKGHSGSGRVRAGQITFSQPAAAGVGDMPGRLDIYINPDGSTTLRNVFSMTADALGYNLGAVIYNPWGTAAGETGEQRFRELAANGVHYTAFKARDSLAQSTTYVWPATDPTVGQVLSASAPSSGVVNLSWVDQSGGGGGGSPGGSDTQLQRNNLGAFGGISGATSDGTSVTYASGNLIATRPKFITSIDDTNGNEIFKITATASAINEVTVAGGAAGNNPTFTSSGGDTNVGLNLQMKADGMLVVKAGANADAMSIWSEGGLRFYGSGGATQLGSIGRDGTNNGILIRSEIAPLTLQTANSTYDIRLRPNSNIVEHYGVTSTAAQTFNVYNTRTDDSNYERARFKWNSNVFEVGPEAAGTGTQRAMKLFMTNTVTLSTGSGSPEGVVTAGIGSIYQRNDGGSSTTLYIKESGTGNTGWAAHGAGGGITASSTDTFTNKTINAESTGNLITLPFKPYFVAAGCDNASAGPGFDIPTTLGPSASCYGTSPQRFGGLDFADGASALTSQIHTLIPDDWTGSIDLSLEWFSSSTSTNSAVFTVATACVAAGEDLLAPTFNTAQTITDANLATANRLNFATLSTLTTTGCAAGEHLYVRIGRDPSNGSDTLAATVVLVGAQVTYRRGM